MTEKTKEQRLTQELKNQEKRCEVAYDKWPSLEGNDIVRMFIEFTRKANRG